MANSASSTKRTRQNIVRNKHNSQIKAKMRTFIKKISKSIASKDKAKAQKEFIAMQKNIDKTVSKGLIHKNQAARKKSRIIAQIKNI